MRGPDESRLRARVRRALACAALLFGALACALHEHRVAVHEWWSGRGPVVPHDTFPADCGLCHAGGDWTTLRADFAFDHEARTGVALEGAHASAECLRCHNDRGPVALFASRGCAGCHADVHRGRLGSGCEDCHGSDDWRPKEVIAQHARTGFPLVGAHAAAACWQCHPRAEMSDFLRTDTECVSCHRDDLARATDPDHVAQGWIDDCQRCHRPTSWTDAGFDHTSFPLTGRHRSVDCLECHLGGVFAGTPSQCVDCHLDDYQATDDPDHAAAGFPTTCDSCHDTNGWDGARFDHAFPIDGGRHGNLDCIECHVVPGNFGVFSCIDCHAHNQADTDDEHDRVPGYVWESSACYACHPTGDD